MINYRYVEDINNLNVKEFCVDIHIDYLLVFSARVDLHAHALYKSGHVIIQDKVSVTSRRTSVALCFIRNVLVQNGSEGFRILYAFVDVHRPVVCRVSRFSSWVHHVVVMSLIVALPRATKRPMQQPFFITRGVVNF